MIGHYQPLLLLYANPNVEPIDVTLAPDRNVFIPEQLPDIPQGLKLKQCV